MEDCKLEIIRKYNTIADWAQPFLSTFMQDQNLEKEAAVNVKALPKVVWNDSTFYVALDSDEENADVFNEYGNVVTALKGVKSMDDVEQQLNKHVVAEQSRLEKRIESTKVISLEDELQKVADIIGMPSTPVGGITQTVSTPNVAPSLPAQPNTIVQNTGTNINGVQTNNGMQTTDPSINGAVNTVTNTPSDASMQNTNQQIGNAIQQQASNESNKYINAKLQTIIQYQVEDQLKQQNADMHKTLVAYKKKIAKLQDTITQLANTVSDLSDQIHAYKDTGNVYDLKSEDIEMQHVKDAATNTAQEIEAEHNYDLTTPAGRVSLKDRILNDIGTIKMPVEILSEERVPNELESKVQQAQIKDERLSKVASRSLNKTATLAFKKQICPECRNKALTLVDANDKVQDVLCSSCNTRYGVDLDTENIFKYL